MLKRLLLIGFVLVAFGSKGQNLVPNGSFEDILNCPDQPTQFSGYTANWFTPTWGTPDLFSTCANPNQIVGIPINMAGNIYPYDGDCYSGLFIYRANINNPSTKVREYIAVSLNDSLKKDSLYTISFWVSLGEANSCASSNIQVAFNKNLIHQNNYYPPLSIDSSIVLKNNFANIINNKGNWTELSFNFKANGREKYLYLGNFDVDSLTNIQIIDTTATDLSCYYLLDNISLTRITEVGLGENVVKPLITLYPNPANTSITLNTGNLPNAQVVLYDVSGRQLVQQKVTSSQESIDVSGLANGVYVCVVSSNGKVVRREKVIVSR